MICQIHYFHVIYLRIFSVVVPFGSSKHYYLSIYSLLSSIYLKICVS